jgi:hypothetical protein
VTVWITTFQFIIQHAGSRQGGIISHFAPSRALLAGL